MTIVSIPLSQIIPNPEQPRQHFDHDALIGLTQSLQSTGLIQPIVVEEADGCYIIHDGERRWRAAQLAGWTHIDAIVRPPLNGSGPRDRLVRALVANVQRADLNPIEEANALARMRDMGMTMEEISQATGMAHHTIGGRLQLLDLEPEIQGLVAAGKLPSSSKASAALLRIPDSQARIKLAMRLARPGISINAIVNACQRLRERLEQERRARTERTPALVLVGRTPDKESVERWENIRAAAQGMCDQCDANPRIPDAPEPAWELITAAARETCEACSLRHTALLNNLAICRECPGVELLRRLATHG